MSDTEFGGKTVVITGAGGGLGAALVTLFAARGARVTGCDQSAETLDNPAIWSRHSFDLLQTDSLDKAAALLLERDGVPDVLINNAGGTRAENLAMLDAASIASEIALNLTGVMTFTDPIAKAMARRGQGSIVFISSVNALAHFGNPAYAAAKAGINGYARAIAVELGRSGVRANIICPGSIHTQAWDHRVEKHPDIFEKLRRFYPLGRIVRPEEVAEAAAFLASSRASGITGITMPVDAGLSAGSRPFIEDILG